jgi:hypothetical protein
VTSPEGDGGESTGSVEIQFSSDGFASGCDASKTPFFEGAKAPAKTPASAPKPAAPPAPVPPEDGEEPPPEDPPTTDVPPPATPAYAE